MAYQLAAGLGDSVAVPQLVFSRLSQLEDDWLRVALYVISTAQTDPAVIAAALHLKSPAAARAALVYWKGAGLLVDKAPCAQAALAAGNLDSAAHRRLTITEAVQASQNDPSIALLIQESQHLIGGMISERDTTTLVSLYIEDKMPIEMILLGIGYCIRLGKRSMGYIERVLLTWQRNGINTGEAAEQYLQLLALRAKHEAEVAQLLERPSAQFTKTEARMISSWYEEMKFSRELLQEAIALSGEKKDLRYINGILRRWFSQGKQTLKDVMAESATTAQNIQPSSSTPSKGVLTGVPRRAPSFKKTVES